MAKKKGNKGKQKKQSEKEVVEEEPKVSEEDVLKAQLKECEEQFDEIKSHCLELENENEKFQTQFTTSEEDLSEIIEWLNGENQKRDDEIAELRDQQDCLEKNEDLQTAEFQAIITQLQADCVTLEEHLSNEAKIIQGKINALDETDQRRDELACKTKIQEKLMEEQDGRHKKTLYETERKFIISKNEVKIEMENRFLRLAKDLHNATKIRIAALTHSAIRENIESNNQLDMMLDDFLKLTQENENITVAHTKMKYSLELTEDERKMVTDKNREQLRLIDKLSKEHEEMASYIGYLHYYARRGIKLKKDITNMNNELYDKRILQQNLETQLQSAIRGQIENCTKVLQMQEYIKLLQKMLHTTVKTVKDIRHRISSPSFESAAFWTLGETMCNLLQFLNTAPMSQTVIDRFGILKHEVSYKIDRSDLIPKHGSAELAVQYRDTENQGYDVIKYDFPRGGSVGSNIDDSKSRAFASQGLSHKSMQSGKSTG